MKKLSLTLFFVATFGAVTMTQASELNEEMYRAITSHSKEVSALEHKVRWPGNEEVTNEQKQKLLNLKENLPFPKWYQVVVSINKHAEQEEIKKLFLKPLTLDNNKRCELIVNFESDQRLEGELKILKETRPFPEWYDAIKKMRKHVIKEDIIRPFIERGCKRGDEK